MKTDVFFGPNLIRKAISITAVSLLIIVLAIFFTREMGYVYVLNGSSMKGTIEDEDVVLVNKLSYIWKTPARFDLIYINRASDYEGIKRIVGLPGENVKIKDGCIFINDKLLEQNIWNQVYGLGANDIDLTLSEEEYFVLGDNLSFSEDSRSKAVGPIKLSEIVGSPWFCCYPFTNLGWVR